MEERAPNRRRKLWRRGIASVGLLALALVGLYSWQPRRVTLFPRPIPSPHPPVDPEASRLFASGTRVLVVTAHPDDSEFYVGGTLLQLMRAGARTDLVLLTDGDKGYYPFGDPAETSRIRRGEQRQATDAWGGQEIVFLAFPDGRLHNTPQAVEAVVRELRRFQPDYVMAFDPNYAPRHYHRDHTIAGEITWDAVKQWGGGRWLMLFETRAPNYWVDVTADWNTKESLLAFHASQFRDRLDFILNLIRQKAEEYGKAPGVPLAEGFRCVRLPLSGER